AYLPVPVHRVRARPRGRAEVHRRGADRVPELQRLAPQGLQRRRCGVQGVGLLPDRQPQGAVRGQFLR
ncbi:MAG: hypothetical protein AVDCRST_MAG48-3176, partial [uncultured Friedmanniella sp.]